MNYSKEEIEIIKLLSINPSVYQVTRLPSDNKPFSYLLSITSGKKPIFYFNLDNVKCKIHYLTYGAIDNEKNGVSSGTTIQIRRLFQSLLRNVIRTGQLY